MKSLLRTLGYTHNMLPFYAKISLCSILVALTGIAMPYVISRATTLMVEVVEGNNIGVGQVLWLAALHVHQAQSAAINALLSPLA